MKRIISVLLLAIMIFSVSCSSGDANGTDTSEMQDSTAESSDQTQPVTDAETDAPEEEPIDVGLDITNMDKVVSICYSTWFDPVAKEGQRIYNITEILENDGRWGNYFQFHYWAEPALGYYTSSDKEVIRTHMTQLADAGVDFIIIDNTNANYSAWAGSYWDSMVTRPCKAILDTILEMKAEGKKTPHVVFWNRTKSGGTECGWRTCEVIYEQFYRTGKYADCWVYWNGKPLMLCAASSFPNQMKHSGFKYVEKFTMRDMTVKIYMGRNIKLGKSEWTFLNDGAEPCKDANGNYEQISVYVARQTDYMSNTSSAIGRDGGRTFLRQWKRVFETNPKIVTLTWWNEWIAQRQHDINGRVTFVDNYTEEYSRDIEPMKGGHGDKYYQWMKQYIAAYKAGEECPKNLIDE